MVLWLSGQLACRAVRHRLMSQVLVLTIATLSLHSFCMVHHAPEHSLPPTTWMSRRRTLTRSRSISRSPSRSGSSSLMLASLRREPPAQGSWHVTGLFKTKARQLVGEGWCSTVFVIVFRLFVSYIATRQRKCIMQRNVPTFSHRFAVAFRSQIPVRAQQGALVEKATVLLLVMTLLWD